MRKSLLALCGLAILFGVNANAGSVCGTVYVGTDGVLTEGAIVSVGRLDMDVTTDTCGFYLIEDIDPGMYIIRATYPGEGEVSVINIPVTEYATTRFNFISLSGPETMYQGDVLNGRMIGMDDAKRVFAFSPETSEAVIRVLGNVQEVSVCQSFQNSSDEVLEVAFVFPMAYYSFCNSFRASVGGRSVVGEYVSSDVAEEEFADAIETGRISPLMVVDRPYAFNRILGELDPGESLDVEFSYIGPVTQNHDQFEITFPMAVEVEGLARSGKFFNGSPSVMVLGEDIDISVEIDAGLPVQNRETVFLSGTVGDYHGEIQHLPGTSRVPGTDYMLRYSLDNSEYSARALTADGYFMLALEPELLQLFDLPLPKEYVFVVDCTSNTTSSQLLSAESFIESFLTLIRPEDRFQIVLLGEEGCFFSDTSVTPDQESLRSASTYLHSLSRNSMELNSESFNVFTDSVNTEDERVVILLSSASIVDYPEFYRAVEESSSGFLEAWFVNLGNCNSISFSNSALADTKKMMMLEAYQDPSFIAHRIWDRVNGFSLEDAVINWGDCTISDVVPHDLPVMYQSVPVFVFGKFEGEFPDTIRLSATLGDSVLELNYPVITERFNDVDLIAGAWAFSLCNSADNRSQQTSDDSLMLRQIALEHSLQTDQTAMFMFDEDSGECVSIFPCGVRYDEIYAGSVLGPYLTSEARSHLTMQTRAREEWSRFAYSGGNSQPSARSTSYWFGEDQISTDCYCYSSTGVVSETGSNGSVSLVSLSFSGEMPNESNIEEITRLIVSAAADVYSERTDIEEVLMVFEGNLGHNINVRNEKAVTGSVADSVFAHEVSNRLREFRFENSLRGFHLKAALLFTRN